MTIELLDKFAEIEYVIIFLFLIILVVLVKLTKKKFKPLTDSTYLNSLSGTDFEDLVVVWLGDHGFKNISKTEYYDLGIDIVAIKNNTTYGIQVKRSKSMIGVNAIRAVQTALKAYDCSKGMVITNSYFTKNAKLLAKLNQVSLIDNKAFPKVY